MHIVDSEDDGYSAEIMKLFTDLERSGYGEYIESAKIKMNKFPNESWDRKYAIAIINLYTQNTSFYSNLNYQMRINYPYDTEEILRRAGELINKGLEKLGPTVHKQVYRGCGMLDDDT